MIIQMNKVDNSILSCSDVLNVLGYTSSVLKTLNIAYVTSLLCLKA